MKQKTALSRCVFLCAFLLTLPFITFSQNNFKVTGKVIDETGKPVDGATVQVKGSTTGTATKADGTFELMVPSGNATLVVTNVGFTDQELALGGKSSVTISLISTASALQDVVVVGYGTRKKTDVTGAVAGINQKDIRSRPVDNALQAMQGKVAGVDITSYERPGQVGSINIGGVRSLTASNSPLFVVDGIPLTTGGIEYLNPNDNALNLIGLDLQSLYLAAAKNPALSLPDFVRSQEPALRVRVPGNARMELLDRHPWLSGGKTSGADSWEVTLTRWGFPIEVRQARTTPPQPG